MNRAEKSDFARKSCAYKCHTLDVCMLEWKQSLVPLQFNQKELCGRCVV